MHNEEPASFKQEAQAEAPFVKGRFVKHYAHGIGVITDVTDQEVYGATLRLIHIQVGSLKLQVPEGKAKEQLSPLSSRADWLTVLPILALDPKPLDSVWHRAAASLAARLEVGTLASLCEVLRDTAQRGEVPIAISRRQVFDTALTRLVEEYRVTFEIPREEVLLVLQQHCPFDISRGSSGRQSVVTRTRNVRRVRSDGDGYRDLYQPKPRVMREKVVKPPKPKREPKVKVPKPPRPPRVPKPKPLSKQEQIVALTQKVEDLMVQLAVAQESAARERLLEATKVANLETALVATQVTVKELTRARGILQSQVTRLKKGRSAQSGDGVSAKVIKGQIAAVRAELFQYIFERTSAVERLEAYIRDLAKKSKT